MDQAAVYIAGVGLCASKSSSSIDDIVLAAGTKALLDAGITYNDVKQSIACFLDRNLNVERKSFDTYGRTGTPVYKVDNYSGLHVAAQLVRSGGANVCMVVGFDQVRMKGESYWMRKHADIRSTGPLSKTMVAQWSGRSCLHHPGFILVSQISCLPERCCGPH
jgi:acetyl-CoA acetyltransferase